MIGSALAMINYLVMAYIDVFRSDKFDLETDTDVS
jgi:hypothetical protein